MFGNTTADSQSSSGSIPGMTLPQTSTVATSSSNAVHDALADIGGMPTSSHPSIPTPTAAPSTAPTITIPTTPTLNTAPTPTVSISDHPTTETHTATPEHHTIAPGTPTSDELMTIKHDALTALSPLIGHLDQKPEEKFRTTMMLIQAADDQTLIKTAYEAAQSIEDEKVKAQALLDVVNEINYFTTPHHHEEEQ